jgi:4-hydroxybenzoate polyprenyltransferase
MAAVLLAALAVIIALVNCIRHQQPWWVYPLCFGAAWIVKQWICRSDRY